MKTKLEMAHEWYMKHSESPSFMYTEVEQAWQYADAMQAEADKREKQNKDEFYANLADPMKKVREQEWQPDWSQAPKNTTHWGMELGSAYWLKEEGDHLFYKIGEASLFGYTGSQQDSLRKRPK